MAKKVLTKKEVDAKLKKLDDWRVNPKYTQISRTVSVSDFLTGLSLVAQVTVYAEVQKHHPDIELSYGKVKFKLTSHEEGGITNADFTLANRIDALAENN